MPRGSARRFDRQREVESRYLPQLALRPDPAAVPLDDALRNVQTESYTAAIVPGDLQEPAEDRFQLVGRNADAGIAHRKSELVSEVLDRDGDCPIGGSELQRIAQE